MPYTQLIPKNHELNDMMLKALRAMAAGATARNAARSSGLAMTPAYFAYLDSKRFEKDFAPVCDRHFRVHLLPLAIAAITRALQPDSPLKLQLDAARIVCDRAGLPAMASRQDFEGNEATIDSMSRDELHAFVKSAEAKLAELATPVDATQPDGEPT
jgi:hypothetical protein